MTAMIHPEIEEKIKEARLDAAIAEEEFGQCFGGVVVSLSPDEAERFGVLPTLSDVSFFITSTTPQEGIPHDSQ